MSSTTYFTKGHSTRIAPPCGSYCRVTERFGLKILFAGLFFVLLFGLFTVPVAAEDDLSPKLRVLSIEDRLLTSIDGDTIYLNSPIIFAVDVPANADIKVNQDRYPEEDLVIDITGNGLDSHIFSLYVSDTVGTTEYIENFFSSSYFPNGEYDVKVKYQKSDGTIGYSNTVSFTVSSEQDIALSGLGTESNPYLIQSPADLKLLSDEVKSGKTFADTYFAITNNIDLSSYSPWQPIGDMLIGFDLTDTESPYGGIVYSAYSQNIFCGIVDGRDNTISHLTTDNTHGGGTWDFNGLFGVVGPGAVIKNLILTDVDISSGGYHYTGGLIGGIYGYQHYGSDTIIVENCHVDGEVNGNGGLIGRAFTEAAPITISKCSAKVSGVLDPSGGGLIGQVDTYSSSGDITILECFVNLVDGVIVGAGFVSSVSAVDGSILIKDCYVSGQDNINTYSGLITVLRADSASSVTIENCYSDATVSTGYPAGGLIGSMDAVDKYSEIESSISSIPGTLTVKNSVYLGNSVTGDTAGKIVGAVYRDEGSGEITLDKLYAIDDVELTSYSSNEYGYDGLTVSSSDSVTRAFYEDTLGWDFDTVWKMDSSVSPYPILQQISTSEPVEEYTITFDSNGGTGSMGSANVSAGESYTLPECTFTAPDGQVFKAWLIGSTEYVAGTSYTPTASVTVKAVWTVEDTTAPGIFTINPLENGIVSWTVSEGATGYKFSLRDRTISETEDTGKKVNNEDVGTATNYDISSYLVEGHSYRVAVCAYNDAGKETWVELEFVFGNCQHTNLVDVDITYNGITKDFPQDAGDGRTHYWYVNKVCDDCKEVQQENVKRNAEHNANTLEKNGVCECNYHRYETGLSYTMYAVEDANTYLAPEENDGYHGGSISKDEEVTVFSDRLGDDGSWSLIEYSVTGTSREKVRFVKSESLDTNEKVTITIFYPTEDTVCLASENPEIHWVASKDTVAEYEIKLYSEDNRLLGQPSLIQGVDGVYNYEYTIPESSILGGTKSYKAVVSALSNSNEVIGEDTVLFKIKDSFVFPDDTWGFDNSASDFKPFLEKHVVYEPLIGNLPLGGSNIPYYYFTWDDYSAVCGDDEISKNVYEILYAYNEEDSIEIKSQKKWQGSCSGMVVAIIGSHNKLISESGFVLGDKTYHSLYDIGRDDMYAIHPSFNSENIKNIGHYIQQLHIYQLSVDVSEVRINTMDEFNDIISLLENDEIVRIDMSGRLGVKNPAGAHSILGYAINTISSTSTPDIEIIRVSIYNPNHPGKESYIEFIKEDDKISKWTYVNPDDTENIYSSTTHAMFYMSESDVLNTYYVEAKPEIFKFKYQDELVYAIKESSNPYESIILQVINRDGEKEEILLFYDSDSLEHTKLYRIPKDVVEIQSPAGGEITIMDTHSSVELTLDAGTTASVIVDDTKESSVEITSDVENQNHEFTVTYGYDSAADKGYQEATVKGTMSDTFKGEATENGLKLTGLDSAEILVENSKGESVSVGTIQNADEYEDIVIDIDTSVKVTGNKDGVSDVLVSVPLNKVQYESSGSSKNTGSGNYAEYPRTVTNGGYVDFGTSPVVKGVTLPEGVSGKVVLIAKSETPAPEGKEAYGVFEINVDSYPIGEKAVISFTIPLSDLQKKGFTEKDICHYHFDGEVWTKLPTTYTVEGDKVFYEAETTAFSPFAIVYEKDGATSAAVSETPVEPEKPSDEPVSIVPEVPSSSEPQETESPAPVLGMTLGALGAAVLMRRK